MQPNLAGLLFFAMLTEACASAFPAASFDYGRGSEPLPLGAARAQGGIGVGVAPFVLTAGGGAGLRYERQALTDVSLSIDVGLGVQSVIGLGLTTPFAVYAGTQWNPFGFRAVALRLRAGAGVDAPFLSIPFAPTISWPGFDAGGGSIKATPAPYLAVVPEIVVSPWRGPITPYFAANVGGKQFFGPRATAAREFMMIGSDGGFIDRELSPSITAGIDAATHDALHFYAAATVECMVLFGVTRAAERPSDVPVTYASPGGGVQAGIAGIF